MTLRKSLTMAFVLSLALASAMSARPNFTGNWKLNAQKSDYGPMPAPESSVLKIDHNDPEIKVSANTSTQMGDMSFEAKYTTDGKENTNNMGPMVVKTTSTWDGEALVQSGKMDFDGNEITMKGKWTLSEDGKTMTQASHVTSPQGEFDMKAVYEKQAK